MASETCGTQPVVGGGLGSLESRRTRRAPYPSRTVKTQSMELFSACIAVRPPVSLSCGSARMRLRQRFNSSRWLTYTSWSTRLLKRAFGQPARQWARCQVRCRRSIGYAAASGGLDAGAFALFLILFVWQFPHFYAIAWMYREDYARGGIRMLPVIEPDGESTAKVSKIASLNPLVPISLVPSLPPRG